MSFEGNMNVVGNSQSKNKGRKAERVWTMAMRGRLIVFMQLLSLLLQPHNREGGQSNPKTF